MCGEHDIAWKSSWKRLIGSYTSPYWRSGISSTSVRNSVFSRVERSGTSGKTLNFSHEWKKSQIFNKDECKYMFLPFQLKNKAYVDFIHSFTCQCHVYYTKYYNATCNAVNTHLFKTALNLHVLGEISYNSGKIDIWSFFRSTKTTIYITTAVVEADSIDYTRPIWLADNAM